MSAFAQGHSLTTSLCPGAPLLHAGMRFCFELGFEIEAAICKRLTTSNEDRAGKAEQLLWLI